MARTVPLCCYQNTPARRRLHISPFCTKFEHRQRTHSLMHRSGDVCSLPDLGPASAGLFCAYFPPSADRPTLSPRCRTPLRRAKVSDTGDGFFAGHSDPAIPRDRSWRRSNLQSTPPRRSPGRDAGQPNSIHDVRLTTRYALNQTLRRKHPVEETEPRGPASVQTQPERWHVVCWRTVKDPQAGAVSQSPTRRSQMWAAVVGAW